MNRLTQDGTLFSVTVEGDTTFYFVSDSGVAAKCYFKDPSLVDGKMGLVRISGITLEHDENCSVHLNSTTLADKIEIRQPEWLAKISEMILEHDSVHVRSIILVDEVELRQPEYIWITHEEIMSRLA